MIIELIGTWMVIGFFSAIGWGTAQKSVVEPYVNPAIEKVIPQQNLKYHLNKNKYYYSGLLVSSRSTNSATYAII